MATHSSILAWRILWPGRLQSTGSQRIRHDWVTQQPQHAWTWKFIFSHLSWIKHSVQFSRSVKSDSLRPHGLQNSRPPCPSPTAGAYSNSCPLNQWCHPTISSSVVTFSSHLQSFPASGSFQMSQLFASGGQSTGVSASASVLPMNTQDWSPLWTGWISLQSKGLSRVFFSTTLLQVGEERSFSWKQSEYAQRDHSLEGPGIRLLWSNSDLDSISV